jgi:hypothetical protein
MTTRKFNWPIWAGLLLSLVALFSYPFLFVRFPVTRDFPWANLLLFLVAIILVATGARRAFARDLPHPWRSRIIGALVAGFSVLLLGFFIMGTFVMGRQLPPSKGAPQLGQKAPDFTLSDTNGKPVSLVELTTAPINGKAPRGVLLIFYRGYW